MIIQNGYIKAKVKTGGGIDASTGYPISITETWGDTIPCQYKVNNYSNLGSTNGNKFTIASYEILIEDSSFTAEQIKLFTDNEDLGEFSIISAEDLSNVGLIKITI